MGNDRINRGTEHGVEWKVDSSHFDPVIISARNIKSGEEESVIYKCAYRPICGYDVEDNANIEKILDDLIKKYADDGYGKEQLQTKAKCRDDCEYNCDCLRDCCHKSVWCVLTEKERENAINSVNRFLYEYCKTQDHDSKYFVEYVKEGIKQFLAKTDYRKKEEFSVIYSGKTHNEDDIVEFYYKHIDSF